MDNNDEYYAFPGVIDAIEFKRKRKPMGAATKKKISQALEKGRSRIKNRKRKKDNKEFDTKAYLKKLGAAAVIGTIAGGTLGYFHEPKKPYLGPGVK